MTQWWESAPLAEEPTPKAAKAGGYWWESAPLAEKPGVFRDVATAAGTGVAKGVAGLAGIPGDIEKAARWGQRYLTGMTPEQQDAYLREHAAGYSLKDKLPVDVSSAGVRKGVEAITGPLPEPQTTAGKYVETVAEFVPGALAMGPGGIIRKLATGAVAPGVAAEGAGQATHGTPYEPWARAGAAVVAGGGAALATAPRSSEMAISRGLAALPAAQRQGAIQQAELLIQDAAGMGVRLTWDEAIQQVTGGATRLGDLRRVVENSRGGGDVMKPLMAERPGQVTAAAGNTIGGVAPNPMNSVQTGTAVQRGATQELGDAQVAVNAATRPDYAAAGRQRVTPPVGAALAGDDIYAATLREVRGDPALNRGLAHLPDDNVQVVDLVQRRIRENAENARVPGEASSSNLRAANLEDARTAPIEAADQATGGRYGDYARARAGQQTLRENFLEPLNEGPLGKLAATSDVTKQTAALLPSKPPPESTQAIAETVFRVSRQNPQAAESLIHSHIRGAFDEAAQANATGPNQFGGAKFAAVVAGNGQQARNLEAAVRALPNGDARWQGFRRFLDVMEATGQRPQQGSATSFNTEIQREMKQGGLIQEGVAAAKTGGMSMLRRFQDYRETLNLGRNTEQIARILTDPQSGRLLERMANAPQSQLPVLAVRLSYMGRQGGRSASPGYRSTRSSEEE